MNQKQLIAHLESIIDRKDKRTQAILITGPWGCGKTHAINEVFSDTKYSSIKEIYVSLFGVSRLEDIFDKILIEISTRRKGFKISHIRRIATDFLGEGKKTFEKFGGFASIVQKAIIDNYLDSDSYLVIDDLERASESITAKQLLGFIEAMKERCKVIAIGNIENSSPEMEKEFRQYQERVFDRQYMIDEIDEGIYHSIASRIKAKEIPDYAIEIIINTFAQVFESNLRTFIKIIDEVNDICNFPGVEAILQSREAIQTFSALMIEKHSNGTKIETLEKAMFETQDNTYRSFISKYDLPNRIGFSIGPFVSCINSKNLDIDAILSVL
jgi:Cdc6-like AAA superfamily ATPase